MIKSLIEGVVIFISSVFVSIQSAGADIVAPHLHCLLAKAPDMMRREPMTGNGKS